MMWRKRKKQRKMFQNAGCKNYKQYQQKLRFLAAAYTTNGCTLREFARRIKAVAEKIKYQTSMVQPSLPLLLSEKQLATLTDIPRADKILNQIDHAVAPPYKPYPYVTTENDIPEGIRFEVLKDRGDNHE